MPGPVHTLNSVAKLALTILVSASCILAQKPAFTTIYSFTGGADGSVPSGPLVAGADGLLYGATLGGGSNNHGAVFSLAPPSSPNGAWVETVLYSFAGGSDGEAPSGIVLSSVVSPN